MTKEYKVGYGRPPQKTQFKKGCSGNPKGRPKRSRNFKTALRENLHSLVAVSVDGKSRQIPRAEAIALSLISGSLKGDNRARDALLRAMQVTGLLDEQEEAERGTSAEEQQVLALHEALLRRQIEAQLKAKHRAKTKKNNGRGGNVEV